MRVNKKPYLLFLLLLGAAIIVSLFCLWRYKLSKREAPLPALLETPPAGSPEAPGVDVSSTYIDSAANRQLRGLSGPNQDVLPQELIVDLENLRVVKEAEQEVEHEEANKPFLQLPDVPDRPTDASGDSPVLYQKGRLKVGGKATLAQPPEKGDSLDELREKIEVESNVGVDF